MKLVVAEKIFIVAFNGRPAINDEELRFIWEKIKKKKYFGLAAYAIRAHRGRDGEGILELVRVVK